MRNLLEEAMLEELQEVYPQDINNYFYVKDLKNIFNISSNMVYKMLKDINPVKYKIKSNIENSYSYYVLISKTYDEEFKNWIQERKKNNIERLCPADTDDDEEEEPEEPKEPEVKFSEDKLSELKALHPLVTDVRFFKDSYFPDVTLEEIKIE